MQRQIHLLSLLFLVLLPTLSVAQDEAMTRRDSEASDSLRLFSSADSLMFDSGDALCWPNNLCEKIDILLTSDVFETSQVGLFIYDLTADSALYRYNERQLMRPASTQKMVTAVAALDLLGSDYAITTRLSYTGDIVGSTLFGNIYCKGAMDPMLSSNDMRLFAESVKALGIDTIQGKIVADLTMKDSNRLGEGWCWDDKNPTLTPLLYGSKDTFLENFVVALEREGIYLDVAWTEGATPSDAREIATAAHTIEEVMQRMMKKSDNLFAEAVFYQVASRQGGRGATAKHAATVIKRLINKTGLKADNYKIADGSGLSLYNYLSAEAEVELLKYAWKDSEIFLPLYRSMPIAGIDGTLQSRMKGTRAEGNVHAKTGTVTAVSALAGYCTAANGHELCFAIINNGLLSTSRGRTFQDRVCTAMCEAE